MEYFQWLKFCVPGLRGRSHAETRRHRSDPDDFVGAERVGIMIGGLGQMAPERKAEIVQLGMKSILAGTFATCLCGAIVGVLA